MHLHHEGCAIGCTISNQRRRAAIGTRRHRDTGMGRLVASLLHPLVFALGKLEFLWSDPRVRGDFKA